MALPFDHNGGPVLRDAGWYATHRDMLTHPIVGAGQPVKPDDPRRGSYSKFEAWHWLIANAAYGEREWNNKGRRQTIAPGQLVAGRVHLSGVWNWTEKTVRVFLKQLLDEHMITLATDEIRGQQRANTCNIITLCNYLRYQLGEDERRNDLGPAKGQQGASEGPAKGHIENKETNKQEEDIRAADAAPMALQLTPDDDDPPSAKPDLPAVVGEGFEAFWKAFPPERRRGKGKCREMFTAIVMGRGKYAGRKVPAADLIAAVKAGAGIDPKFPPMPETWLNQGRWEDAPVAAEPAAVDGKSWGWWRGQEAKYRNLPIERWRGAFASQRPNGTWPWWLYGPPPGHPECLVPQDLISEHGWEEIYRGNITHD